MKKHGVEYDTGCNPILSFLGWYEWRGELNGNLQAHTLPGRNPFSLHGTTTYFL